MDSEQPFLFGLSRFSLAIVSSVATPLRCRGFFSGMCHCFMLSDLLSETVLKQGLGKEVSLTMALLVFSWRLIPSAYKESVQ